MRVAGGAREAFKQATGMPPYRWHLHARISRAQELLQRSDAEMEPNTGSSSTIWVALDDSLEHGEFNGATGLLVFAQTVSCDCYGRRPPS